jgi:ribose transport system permease protein
MREETSRADSRFLSYERLLRLGLFTVHLGPVLILVVLMALISLVAPFFLSTSNLLNLGVQAAPTAILALGMLMVIVTRGIDLSVGSVLALSTVTGALVFADGERGGLLVLAAMLLTGVTVGIVNGLLLVKVGIPHPFIVTLGMLSIASGLALVLSGGKPLPGMPPLILALGSGFFGPIPVPIVLVAALALLAFILTTRTQWGRWIYAVGGNPDAAVRAGIPINKVLVSVYVLSGLCAGFAGAVVAGRTASGYPTAGQLAELDAIAAVIIGGASFFGGRGGVGNAIVGALVIAVIRNGLNLAGVDPNVQIVVIGCVVIGAVALDVLRIRIEQSFTQVQAKGAAR